MEEYDLYGVEDDFESQFASELEVLAELEDDVSSRPGPQRSQLRTKLSFEEAISAGDPIRSNANSKPTGDSNGEALACIDTSKSKKRDASCIDFEEDEFSDSIYEPPITPKHKRARIEAVKKLDFGRDEYAGNSTALSDDITPPPSPNHSPKKNERDSKFSSCEAFEVSDMAPLQVTPTESEQKRVLKRPPVLEDYINVTSTDGSRVYMALKEDNDGAQQKQGNLKWNSGQQLHLLGVPFSYLKEQVNDEHRRKVLEESQRLTEMLNSQINEEFGENDSEILENDDNAGEEDDEDEPSSHSLWVDRFTPRHYTELLSDDYTNRCLLKWLKLWDTVVFGKERVVRKPKAIVDPRANHFKNQKEQQSKFKTKAQITEEILEAELDHHNRPKNKVSLLCGPPGLGKTTLAHVIARHAGYNVVEMNASDDRSPEAFRTRIEAATQMKSVLGVDERPNCLIIDEIDGAPTVSINMLLSLVNRKDAKEAEGGTEATTGKKKKKEGGLLLRPIICICNDQYVPSLRQLRQQAFMLNFPQTMPSRLVQRLYEIAVKQGMKADTGALMALCEKTENDIRSCINTLQFLHGRGKKELNMRSVQTMRIGLKDQNKGLFSVWQEIFQLPKIQRKRIGQEVATNDLHLLLGSENDSLGMLAKPPLNAVAQRFHHILHLSTSTGEYEKLTMGLYDNFLNMKVKESNFSTVCLALDWLEFTDIVNSTIMHGQNFQLMRYLPFLPVAFHLLFAASNVPRIAYPSSHYEAQSKLNQMQNLLNAMVSEISPAIRTRVGPQSLVLDALCLLLDVLSPKLRPVNTQLFSTKEKQQLAELINTMLAYNLTYHQERTMEGQYVYKLDPNVEDVCRFPDLPVRKPLTYQTKQLIAREIELERMRRTEAFQQARNAGRDNTTAAAAVKTADPKGAKSAAKPAALNHEQRLENIMKKATFEEKPEKDFFGRQIVKKVAAPVTASANQEESVERRIGKAVGNSDVWFRFNEGVSNAVRRNIYIKDLL
ncbi:chromosome transmission fidelity protein 18 homolog [Xenopus laevis]|uniref:Chromosome transmission fidelity protein 18 homolog n=1 Tax=Xenopus laevis TaxID=8355 RepID=CTF18_XENLA|nr:chromosome transmission fidelity protein 18 homolog [Xenopus laevis]Q6NU40.1 RecName: Full=Chromosome transmission fidelity protein 18 homolog [Xenopus laevis]AAH68761.1 Chtf18 protein [Xenopus laevis]